MPIFMYEDLVDQVTGGFLKGGFRQREARIIANHLVDAESKGVFSHGLVRVPSYMKLARMGEINTNATPSVTRSAGAVSVVDGGGGLGIAAFEYALDLAMDGIRRHGCFAAAIVNCGHTGRLGAYAERAARNGYMAITMGGGGNGKDWSKVVPFGGAKPVMSTNPYALSMASRKYGPVYVDFATSAVAEGKVKINRVKKQNLPAGSIVDKDGKPSNNPEDFFSGGALLPAAGPKGSGMAIIAELVGCAMLAEPKEFNWLLVLLDIAAFGNRNYDRAADTFLDRVKDTPVAEGFTEVLLPGEMETRSNRSCEQQGIHVTDEIWSIVAPEL
ncbi:Ldh family oxidoreductase [Cupriavidus sp. TMH.W2]|uniref:Ldh family oxidoreductase n=1 Tax=Cupriavidus sp. TMH.W2 TaxID=3434465 RepID=UPI003D7841E6